MPRMPNLQTLVTQDPAADPPLPFPDDVRQSIHQTKEEEYADGGYGWEDELPKPIWNTIQKHLNSGTMKFLGEGGSRVTFAVGGGNVLKVAYTALGITQNHHEVKVSKEGSRWIAKVFRSDPGGRWLVMEQVVPATTEATQFLKLSDAPSPGYYGGTLTDVLDEEGGNLPPQVAQHLTSDQLDLYKFAVKHNLYAPDVYPEHFGKTKDGRLVLMDYGLTR